MISIIGESDPKDIRTRCFEKWDFKVNTDSSKYTLAVTVSTADSSAPDWDVSIEDKGGERWNNFKPKDVHCVGKEDRDFTLKIGAPNGARFGDHVSVLITVTGDGGETDSKGYSANAVQSISTLKTQLNMERDVVDALAKKANEEKEKTGQTDVYAILVPDNLKGYVFVEGMDTDRMREKTRDSRKARAYVDGESHGKVTIDEIGLYLTPLSTTVGFQEGDIVELVDGPFKGSKARVKKVDSDKEEITVELIEALVPIPVTVKGSSVRIVDKEK